MKRSLVLTCITVLTLTGCAPAPDTASLETPPAIAAQFDRLLSGDTSVISVESDRSQVDYALSHLSDPDYSPILELEDRWEYALLDLTGDGTEELFLRPADTEYIHFIFTVREDDIQLLDSKQVGMYYWYEPLSTGELLQTYRYDGTYTYTLYRLSDDGSLQPTGEEWSYRYEASSWREELEVPSWSHNGQPLSQEDFETEFSSSVTEALATDWRPAFLSDGQ